MSVILRDVMARGLDLTIRHVDLLAYDGELVGLLGDATGSAVLRVIAGLRAPFLGGVYIGGEDTANETPTRLRERGVTYLRWDTFRTSGALTVAEAMHGQPSAGRPVNADRHAGNVAAILSCFPVLTDNANVVVRDLAPAEAATLEVARALVASPTVLLLDGLTAVLPPAHYSALLSSLRQVGAVRAVACILAELVTDGALPPDCAAYDRAYSARGGTVRPLPPSPSPSPPSPSPSPPLPEPPPAPDAAVPPDAG